MATFATLKAGSADVGCALFLSGKNLFSLLWKACNAARKSLGVFVALESRYAQPALPNVAWRKLDVNFK